MIDRNTFPSIAQPSQEPVTVITEPEHLLRIVDGLVREYFHDGPDRRSETRMRMSLPTLLEPFDRNGKSLGYTVRAVTRDLSASGVGCTAQEPICGEYVSIRVALPDGSPLGIVGQIVRCEPVGYYYDIGCRLLFQAELAQLAQVPT